MNLIDLKKYISSFTTQPIILCIGSTKIISDSFGPIVGQMLKSSCPSAIVFGSLEHPITALNVEQIYNEIKSSYPYHPIIAVDAFAGNGKADEIKIVNGGIKPGLASGKNLTRVGDVSIIASSATINGHHSLSNVFALASITNKILSRCMG